MNIAAWCRQQARTLDAQLKIVPHDADRQHALAQAELCLGNLRRGFRLFESRLRDRTAGTGWAPAEPRWHGEPPEAGFDGTLYVQLEQGLGDQVMMARYLPWLEQRWAQVVCEVRPPLYRLFRANFGKMIVPLRAAPIEYDYAIPMLSLPMAAGTTERTIPPAPYLEAGHDARFAGRIGFAWAGAPWHRNDASRSLPRELIQQLMTFPAPWLSLQLDQEPVGNMPTIRGLVQDVADTAAIVDSLSLVITCDSLLAHLAGALGVTCWVLLPYVPDWRWQLDRTDSPWYPSVHLFRQRKVGDWSGVLHDVVEALDSVVLAPHL